MKDNAERDNGRQPRAGSGAGAVHARRVVWLAARQVRLARPGLVIWFPKDKLPKEL